MKESVRPCCGSREQRKFSRAEHRVTGLGGGAGGVPILLPVEMAVLKPLDTDHWPCDTYGYRLTDSGILTIYRLDNLLVVHIYSRVAWVRVEWQLSYGGRYRRTTDIKLMTKDEIDAFNREHGWADADQ